MKKAYLSYFSELEHKNITTCITKIEFYIGRGTENDLQIQHDVLISSSKHACIFFNYEEKFCIVNLKGTNGVFVNDVEIQMKTLADNDVIRIGKTKLIFFVEKSFDISHDKSVSIISDGENIFEGSLKDVSQIQEKLSYMPDNIHDLKKSAKRLALIIEIIRNIQNKKDPETALNYILEILFKELGATRGLIGISTNMKDGNFDIIITRDINCNQHSNDYIISKTLREKILTSNQYFLVPDVLADNSLNKVNTITNYNIRSVLGMSIPGIDRIIGMVYFENTRNSNAFIEKDVEFLVAVSHHIGLCVHTFIEKHEITEKFKKVENLRDKIEKVELRILFPGNMSKASQIIIERAKRFALNEETILITGERGTGKTFLSRYIHNQSNRKEQIFQNVSLPDIPPYIIESTLFGHVKGSFTGAMSNRTGLIQDANKGTLFLDEIGDLDHVLQTKLLNFLDTKKYRRIGENKENQADVRIILATNKNLEEEIVKGRFRADLYDRINVLDIHMPSLRERKDDIKEFCEYIIDKLRLTYKNSPVKKISESCYEIFMNYKWPGNIRELESVLTKTFLLCEDITLEPKHLPQHIINSDEIPSIPPDVITTIEDAEKHRILQVLNNPKITITKAAKILGISRNTLYNKIRKIVKS